MPPAPTMKTYAMSDIAFDVEDYSSDYSNPAGRSEPTMTMADYSTKIGRREPTPDPNSTTNLHDQLPSVEEVKMNSSYGLAPRSMWWKIVLLLTFVVVFVVAILQKTKSNSKSMPSPSASSTDTSSLENQLSLMALGGESDFEDEHSYQSLAKRWILEDSSTVKDYSFAALRQRYAMWCLHLATNPSNWVEANGWKRKGVPECEWHGVTCDVDSLLVKRISLKNNGLEGNIPPEVALISSLTVFNVNDNDGLTGSMPTEICSVDFALDVKADCAFIDCECCSNC